MKAPLKLSLILLLVFFTGCKKKTVEKYEQEDQLFAYLQKQKVNLRNKTIVVILQRELCSCTIDDTELSYEILTSPKYDQYNKVLIVPDSNHSIIPRLKLTTYYKNIRVIQNLHSELRKNGLVFAVNRLFVFDNNTLERFLDMHLSDHKQLRTEFL